MNILDPILKQNDVEVKEIIVGVLTGNARDLMTVRNRSVESAYFLPTLKVWLNERGLLSVYRRRQYRQGRGRIHEFASALYDSRLYPEWRR